MYQFLLQLFFSITSLLWSSVIIWRNYCPVPNRRSLGELGWMLGNISALQEWWCISTAAPGVFQNHRDVALGDVVGGMVGWVEVRVGDLRGLNDSVNQWAAPFNHPHYFYRPMNFLPPTTLFQHMLWPVAISWERGNQEAFMPDKPDFDFFILLFPLQCFPPCSRQQPSGNLGPAAPRSVRCCCPLLLRLPPHLKSSVCPQAALPAP